MHYRRNSDDSLRNLGRVFHTNDSDESLMAWNAARARAGLPRLHRVPPLDFGYTAGLPATVKAAYGSRMIVENGRVNFVAGRGQFTSVSREDEQRLRQLLENQEVIQQFRKEASRLIALGEIRGDARNDVTLYENEDLVIKGNTNASYGYLYIVAFLTPDWWEITMPQCDLCNNERVRELFEECMSCKRLVCKDVCGYPCDDCGGFRCYGCQNTGISCASCDKKICPSNRCNTGGLAPHDCRDCGRVYCGDCKEDIIAEGCECADAEYCEDCEDLIEICDDCEDTYCSCEPCNCVEQD